MMKHTQLVHVALVGAFLSFAPSRALAQAAPGQPVKGSQTSPASPAPASPARPPVREGDRNGRAIFGLSFGVGSFNDPGASCAMCQTWSGAGRDINAMVGTFLGKRQALEFEFTAVTPAENSGATFRALTLSYSRWLTSRISVRAGYGPGYLEASAARADNFDATGPGGVFNTGVGVEVVHSRRWSMDGNLRFERIQYLDEPVNYLSMGVSMKFYPPLPRW